MKILIICDESAIAFALKAILDMHGHDVRSEAYDPRIQRRSLDEARNFQPDWVLMFLNGPLVSRQIDTLAKVYELTRARLFLFSSCPRAVELERARKDLALPFQFRLAPFSTAEMLNVLATEE